MYNGLGFFEILVIGILVLMFFGSKELPRFLREAGRLTGQLRRYSEKIRRELNMAGAQIDKVKNQFSEVADTKKKLRAECLNARKALSHEERERKSAEICRRLLECDEVKKAKSIMIYLSTEDEVSTQECIPQLLAAGKRVIVPYVKENGNDLGITAINGADSDLEKGRFGILEPVKGLRDNFFKSDLQLVIVPGVGFDRRGNRIGRGKAYYDNFLKELHGKISVIGIAFECQILKEKLPFEYHDIPVDKVLTENGFVKPGLPEIVSQEPGRSEMAG
jgi:5-formyltetrahydrofolate cyclo-ligase